MKRFKIFISEGTNAGTANYKPAPPAKPPTHVEVTRDKQNREKQNTANQNAAALERARADDFVDKEKELKKKEVDKKVELTHKEADRQAKDLAKRQAQQAQANTNEK